MKENLFDLNGKVVVITGAAGLLGKNHADALAAHGANPILLDLAEGPIIKLSESLNKKYKINSSAFAIDITNEDMVEENANLIIKKYGKIDGLINNAANNPKVEDTDDLKFSRLENFPVEIWNSDINVALTGSFICSKHYGHQISKNSNGGSIINISSDLGLIAPDQSLYAKDGVKKNNQSVKPISYSVVKTGIIGLTRYLATYWAEENVRCNAICPGGVENGQSEKFLNRINKKIPLGRMAKSNEYQSTLVWMISDASEYLNGAIVPVDGGRTIL